jgi:hypothetical protein
MEEAGLRPTKAKLSCESCGLTVERTLQGGDLSAGPWLCPVCDPDKGEDEEPHDTSWMQPAELYGFEFDKQHQRFWIPKGYQECAPHQPVKEVPEWVQDPDLLKKVISSHPQSDRLGEGWAAIVYGYYNLQRPTSWIAKDMGIKLDAVKSVIKKLNKRAATISAKNKEKAVEFSLAQKLFNGGRSVREVRRELNCSVGKAHKLKKLAA